VIHAGCCVPALLYLSLSQAPKAATEQEPAEEKQESAAEEKQETAEADETESEAANGEAAAVTPRHSSAGMVSGSACWLLKQRH
jgi:hypothetical protein